MKRPASAVFAVLLSSCFLATSTWAAQALPGGIAQHINISGQAANESGPQPGVQTGTIRLAVGSQSDLKALVPPDGGTATGSIVWISRNPEIATVSASGVVTAQSVGTATITAALGSDADAAVHQIRVRVVLDGTETWQLTVNEGGLLNLAPLLWPGGADGEVSWRSEQPNLLSVDRDGLVEALNLGSCCITSTRTDEQGAATTRKVTIRVISAHAGNSLREATITLHPGDEVDLAAVFCPGEPQVDGLRCDSANDAVVSAGTGCVITAAGPGSCDVTLSRPGDTEGLRMRVRVVQ